MLVRQQVTAGTEVLNVFGPVLSADLPALSLALSRALALAPRGVVLDLSEAGPVDPGLSEVLQELGPCNGAWPRRSLVVCGARFELQPEVAATQPDRATALAHVDARSSSRERVAVPPGLTGPATARAATTAWAREHGLGALVHDLALVVTELVSNAVRHGCPPVVVELEKGPEQVLVAVDDGSDTSPAQRAGEPDDEGGRGMLLVEHLSCETGVRPSPSGKTVWAALSREDDAPR